MHTIGYLCAAFTVFSWGITFVSTRALLSDFSSLEILFVRFFMAYLVLWLLAPRRLKLESWKEEGYFALAGLTGATIYQMLENMAIEYANASNVVSMPDVHGSCLPGLFEGKGLIVAVWRRLCHCNARCRLCLLQRQYLISR